MARRELIQIDEDGALVEDNSPDRPYGCRGCGKKFKGKRWAQKCCGIDDIDQPEDESAPVFDSTLDKPYICRTCGKGFKGRKWAQKCCNSSESGVVKFTIFILLAEAVCPDFFHIEH